MSDRDPRTGSPAADWLQPSPQEGGLPSYLRTLRERLWLVVIAVVLTTAAAAAYVATADKRYEAEADLLVTPVPAEAESFVSLGLLSRSADPVRDIETVARLVTTNEVAARAKKALEGVPEAQGSPELLLEEVTAEPVAESYIVAVTAGAGSPSDAAAIANEMADATIAERTAALHGRIDDALKQLRAELATQPPGSKALSEQIRSLEILRSGADPTIQIATDALPPASPVAPRPVLSIAGGLLAGLVLGIVAAFASQALDPHLRREDQLRAMFRLPILARVPSESGGRGNRPIGPRQLSAGATEAYRALRATLGPHGASRSRSMLITSPSASEGKTTTAINLATSLTLAGRSVILIEGDLRKPQVGAALGIDSERGVVSVLLGDSSLEESLVSSPDLGGGLRLLLAEKTEPWVSELFGLPSARELVERAMTMADHVIIDSAPLSEVVDALPLATAVDQVLVVVRLGKTRLRQVSELGELLAENGVRPAGFALLGVQQQKRGYYDTRPRRLTRTDPKTSARPRARA